MRRTRGLQAPLTTVALGFLLAAPLSAQSGTTATVSGNLSGTGAQPLAGALVTLVSLDRGGTRETTADRTGAFSFTLVPTGSYEIRAETLGYRPVVARVLTLGAGARASVDLTLTPAPPPVMTVDTVALGAVSGSRFESGGLRLGPGDLEGLPYRHDEIASVAALDPRLDASLGFRGLPGSMSVMVVDGVPVYRAPHPVASSEQLSSPAFPRSALSGMSILHDAVATDWTGAAGGYAGLTTLTGTPGQGLVLEGGWSGGPLWTSGEHDFSTPGLLSFQGAARTTVPVDPGASQIVVAGEAFRQDTPLTPRISEAVASDLAGLDPDLLLTLADPSVETYSRYSGLLRFDSQRETSHLFLRGAAGYARRDLDGPGPLAVTPAAALPEESIDFSFAGGYTRALASDATFELLAGVSGSNRTFDAAENGLSAALLVDGGTSLGIPATGQGESSRTDFVMSPTLSYPVGNGSMKLGLTARLTRHSMLHSQPADYLFSDGASLVAGQGYVAATNGSDVSFSSRELGGFVRFESELLPGFRAYVGTHFDYEWIPGDATLNTDWLETSGLRNDDYPGGFAQLGGHVGFTWSPDAATSVFGSFAAQHGDLDSSVLGQLLSRDVDASQTTFAGSGLTWPDGVIPAGSSTRSTLTLLGHDTRAPRSFQAGAGIVRDISQGWSVHAGAGFRRTDFLVRRRNLNLPLLPQAADPNGRGIYGTLQQDGSLVSATGDDRLRFDGFNSVWALDSDGWSEYVGMTGGLEYSTAVVDLFAAYTYSETTDNWVGAATGLIDAELSPLLPDKGWSEGTSDFDVPHRVSVAVSAEVSPATISAVYRFRSGYPFTPAYRDGVDANGDGSLRNDVAFVEASVVDPLLSDWSCLDDQVGGFAVRNSCRRPSVHSVDLRLRVRLGRVAGREASLVVDGFNLVESSDGVVDDALLMVDPAGSITASPDGSVVTIPFMVNPDFGSVIYPTSRGRMIRVGFRIG